MGSKGVVAGLMGLTELRAGLTGFKVGLAELRAGLAELAGLVLLTELLISALTAHKCCHNESGLLRRRLQWASLNRLLVEFVRALEAVMRVSRKNDIVCCEVNFDPFLC